MVAGKFQWDNKRSQSLETRLQSLRRTVRTVQHRILFFTHSFSCQQNKQKYTLKIPHHTRTKVPPKTHVQLAATATLAVLPVTAEETTDDTWAVVGRAWGIRLRVEIWPCDVWITLRGCPPFPPSCRSGLPVSCIGFPPTIGCTMLPPALQFTLKHSHLTR